MYSVQFMVVQHIGSLQEKVKFGPDISLEIMKTNIDDGEGRCAGKCIVCPMQRHEREKERYEEKKSKRKKGENLEFYPFKPIDAWRQRRRKIETY